MGGGRRLGRAEEVHVAALAVGEFVVYYEGLLEGGDVLGTVLQRDEAPVDVRIDELEVLEGVLPADEEVEEGLRELLLDVDALVHRLPHQSPHELVLVVEVRVRVGEDLMSGGLHKQPIIFAEGRPE